MAENETLILLQVITIIITFSSVIIAILSYKHSKRKEEESLKISATISEPYDTIKLVLTNTTNISLYANTIKIFFHDGIFGHFLIEYPYDKKIEAGKSIYLNSINRDDLRQIVKKQKIEAGYFSILYIQVYTTRKSYKKNIKIIDPSNYLKENNIYSDSRRNTHNATELFLGMEPSSSDYYKNSIISK